MVMIVADDKDTVAKSILAIDTSTEACSAALTFNGKLYARYEVAPRKQAALILPMVQSLLAESDVCIQQLDALAFCRGPGSFTGVRIGAGVIQGLALAADLPVIPVSSLQALAQRANRETGIERVVGAIDARMGEVYWAVFRLSANGLMVGETKEAVSRPSAVIVPPPAASCWGAGTGWSSYGTCLHERCAPGATDTLAGLLPHARDALPMAGYILAREGGAAAEEALPVYLRDRVTG